MHKAFIGHADDLAVVRARRRLTAWIREQAAETAAELGFGYRPSENAPATAEALSREFRASRVTGLPLRVSNRYSATTMYCHPADNWAFRFVHDTRHVWLGAGFELEDELAVASCHLARLRRSGFGPETIEFRMLYADTAGQSLFFDRTGAFPINQLRFVLRVLEHDIETAIDAEFNAQRSEARAS